MGNPIYDRIAEELHRGEIDEGLWTEAFALSNGNLDLTKARYVQLRARALKKVWHPRKDATASKQDFFAAWIWSWSVVFGALAGIGVFATLMLAVSNQLGYALPSILVGGLCAWGCRWSFRRTVLRLEVSPPSAKYWFVEILLVSCFAAGLGLWNATHYPDRVFQFFVLSTPVLVTYGIMVVIRARILKRHMSER